MGTMFRNRANLSRLSFIGTLFIVNYYVLILAREQSY
jgi:hypothetical protein